MSFFSNVDLGALPNDGTGSPLRDAFAIVNQNFAEIAAGNITVVYTSPVQSVAGRTGNIVLTTQDVYGAVSQVYIQNQIAAGNAYVNAVAASIGSSNVAVINANVSAANLAISALQSNTSVLASSINTNTATINLLNANVTAANINIATLFANAATQYTSLNTLTSNSSAQEFKIETLQSNAAVQAVDRKSVV